MQKLGKYLYWYTGKVYMELNRILNQVLVCELWRDLLNLTPIVRDPKSSKDKTFLATADCFSTRQSCLCHGPGSDTSENTKTRLSKASCHLPIHHRILLPHACRLVMWTSYTNRARISTGFVTNWRRPAGYRYTWYMSEEVPEVKLEDEIKEPVGQKVGTQGEWVAVSDCTCKPNLLFFLLW